MIKILIVALSMVFMASTRYAGEETTWTPLGPVTISIEYDTLRCQNDYPLNIRISNNRPKKLNKVSFTVGAHYMDRSTDLVKSWDSGYSSDHIIDAFGDKSLCYKAPEVNSSSALSDLVWEITAINNVE